MTRRASKMTSPRRLSPRRRPVRATPAPLAANPIAPVTAHRPRWLAGILCGALFIVYLSNLHVRSAGDNIPTRLLPFSLLRERNVNLDEFPRLQPTEHRLYYAHEVDGHIYSGSPIATAFVVAPLYVLPAWYLSAHRVAYDDVRAQLLIAGMERISAATLVVLSAALLLGVLERLVSWQWAAALTLVYALGTDTWAVSSQALWPHALSELALAVLCWIFLGRRAVRLGITAAGVVTAVAVANRPQLLPVALLTAVFVWRHHRRHILPFIGVPLVVAACLAAYNIGLYQNLAGGYAGFRHFSTPVLAGLGGLLVSPNRGLLVFTPIMLFAAWGAVRVWRVPADPWLRYLVIALAAEVLLYAKFDEWWAGFSYGPRYLTDLLPILCLLLVYGLVPWCRTRPARIAAAALALYGVTVQAIGVYCDNDDWNRHPVSVDQRPERVWDWSDLQVVRALGEGWHGGDLWPLLLTAFRDPVPAHLVPLRAADLASAYAVRTAPVHLRPGAGATAVIAVTNLGTRTWPAFAADVYVQDLVFLVARWQLGGRALAGVGNVLPLPQDVCPREQIELRVPLTAPAAPGTYTVELRIVQATSGAGGMGSADVARLPIVVD